MYDGLGGRPHYTYCYSVPVDASAHVLERCLDGARHVEHLHWHPDCLHPNPSTMAGLKDAVSGEKAPSALLICFQASDLHSQCYSAGRRYEKALKMVSFERTEIRRDGSEHELLLELGLQRPGCAGDVSVDLICIVIGCSGCLLVLQGSSGCFGCSC